MVFLFNLQACDFAFMTTEQKSELAKMYIGGFVAMGLIKEPNWRTSHLIQPVHKCALVIELAHHLSELSRNLEFSTSQCSSLNAAITHYFEQAVNPCTGLPPTVVYLSPDVLMFDQEENKTVNSLVASLSDLPVNSFSGAEPLQDPRDQFENFLKCCQHRSVQDQDVIAERARYLAMYKSLSPKFREAHDNQIKDYGVQGCRLNHKRKVTAHILRLFRPDAFQGKPTAADLYYLRKSLTILGSPATFQNPLPVLLFNPTKDAADLVQSFGFEWMPHRVWRFWDGETSRFSNSPPTYSSNTTDQFLHREQSSEKKIVKE